MKADIYRLAWRVSAGLSLLAALAPGAVAGKPQPPPAPTSDLILFAQRSNSRRAINTQLYRVYSNGSGTTQVTTGGTTFNTLCGPSVTRTLSAGRIAHKTSPGVGQEIHLINIDGSNDLTAFRTPSYSSSLWPPLWTPDDSLVCFAADTTSHNCVVVFIRADGVGYPLELGKTDAQGNPLTVEWDMGIPADAVQRFHGFTPDLRDEPGDGSPLQGYVGLLTFTLTGTPSEMRGVLVDTTALTLPDGTPAPMGDAAQLLPETLDGQPVTHPIAIGGSVGFAPVRVGGKYRVHIGERVPIMVMDLDRDPVTGLPLGLPLDFTAPDPPQGVQVSTALNRTSFLAWAPDASGIVFSSDINGSTADDADWEIFRAVVPTDLANVMPAVPVRVTTNSYRDASPAWWMPPAPYGARRTHVTFRAAGNRRPGMTARTTKRVCAEGRRQGFVPAVRRRSAKGTNGPFPCCYRFSRNASPRSTSPEGSALAKTVVVTAR